VFLAVLGVVLMVRNLHDAVYSEPGFAYFDVPTLGRQVMLQLQQSL
jgi:hypothetical protein